LIVSLLKDEFLAWLEHERGPRKQGERSRHRLRFTKAHGKRELNEITPQHPGGIAVSGPDLLFLGGAPRDRTGQRRRMCGKRIMRWGQPRIKRITRM